MLKFTYKTLISNKNIQNQKKIRPLDMIELESKSLGKFICSVKMGPSRHDRDRTGVMLKLLL